MIKKTFIILLLFSFLIFFSVCCSTTTSVAGGSSSGTGVIITTFDGQISGVTIKNISVSIYINYYFPVKDSGYSAKTNSDTNGNFNFSCLENNYYNILFYDSVNKLGLFVSDIPLVENKTYSDTIDNFEIFGGIKGQITIAKVTKEQYENIKLSSVNTPVYLYIYGSPFFTIADDSLGFIMKEIPPEKYTIAINFIPVSNSDSGNIVTNNNTIVLSDSIVEW